MFGHARVRGFLLVAFAPTTGTLAALPGRRCGGFERLIARTIPQNGIGIDGTDHDAGAIFGRPRGALGNRTVQIAECTVDCSGNASVFVEADDFVLQHTHSSQSPPNGRIWRSPFSYRPEPNHASVTLSCWGR